MMTTTTEEPRMLRRQYHLSAAQVRRIETLRAELGLRSDAELIRRAVDTFDPDALSASEREMVEATAVDLLKRIEDLNTKIESTLEQATRARKELNDPVWIERIRERTRREAEEDPSLVTAVAHMIRT